MKQKIIPLVSIVIGILAGILTYQYIQSERRKLRELEERIYAGAQKIKVMIATRNIPAGTTIKVSDLDTDDEFERVVGDRAVPHKQGKVLLRMTIDRWGPIATGGFPARLAESD